MAIQIENLSFIYNPKSAFKTEALKNITLNIDDGDFLGIIGQTGSGKSTLIQHFNALILPQEGKLTVAGIEVKAGSKELRLLRAKCGMVFQYPEYQLFGETVEDDIAFGLINFLGRKTEKSEGLTAEEIAGRVKEAMRLVGLPYDEFAKRSPFQLSGGQKRRVAIAGIIVTKPEILILDEPSSGLDPKGKQEILRLIRELKETTSPTIIMISHDMDEIAENCDKVAVMAGGEIKMCMPPEELFTHAEELEALSLDIPIIAKVRNKLKEKGIDVPYNKDYSVFAKSVAKALKGERK
ncbi:MAG: energy-coupling factor transporter ATPase [Clostridia bacterium]